ncbi:MAG TPA: imidazoleglycerol-phosphate dehydratase HisB [Nitrospiria bacterium]|nr:imidazoleglycerol-phosphate dehydratase HisB [Nitrospiria bacterium]
MERRARIVRNTSETNINVELLLDGKGTSEIKTPIPFMDHMLTLMARHGLMDLHVKAGGDIEVDYHHLVEDIGIVLGDAISKALGDKSGISRYGSARLPMDETLSAIDLDISGRPYLVYNVRFPGRRKIKEFDLDLMEEFFRAFVNHAGLTLHMNLIYGKNVHHIAESLFKGLGRALAQAVKPDARIKGVLSTKGKL